MTSARKTLRAASLVVAAAVAGCCSGASLPEPPASHPASSFAAEAPLPPRPPTLAVAVAAPEAPASAPASAPAHRHGEGGPPR